MVYLGRQPLLFIKGWVYDRWRDRYVIYVFKSLVGEDKQRYSSLSFLYSYIKLENPTPVSLCAHSLTHYSDGSVDLNNSFPVRLHYPQQLDKRFWERHRRQKQYTPFNLFANDLVIHLQKCFHLPNISPFLAYSVTMYSMSLVSMTCKDKNIIKLFF